jgi:hypothetical protein
LHVASSCRRVDRSMVPPEKTAVVIMLGHERPAW